MLQNSRLFDSAKYVYNKCCYSLNSKITLEYVSSKSILGVYRGSLLPEHNFCPLLFMPY